MSESTGEITVDRKLCDIFEEAFDLYDSFDTCTDPTNSPEFQANIKKCMRLFEDCTRLVSICGLFSSNESYTEVPTNDLKYLLLPFFLGQLSQKICGGDRVTITEVSEEYFKDFLKRCAEYELHEPNTERSVAEMPNNDPSDQQAALTRMVLSRNQKLEQYKKKKELDDQVKQLKLVMKQEHVDEEIKRDFYVKLLKASILEAEENLKAIAQEKVFLEFRKNQPQESAAKPKRPQAKPLKPVIITKDLAQKAVYGLGYPSIPTMTVSEFYDQRVRDGIFPDPNAVRDTSMQSIGDNERAEMEEQQDIDRELKLDADDDYELARARAKDDYKDDHRRGEGNRYNRS